MQQQILNFLHSLILQDYLIIWLSVSFWITFCFIWLEKLHKSYLWVILWLFMFSLANLMLFSLNQNDVWLSSFKEFFINNRNTIALWSIILIPIFAVIIPLNSWIYFRLSDKKGITYIASFFLWFFYVPFLFTIFLSILNNRFLFSIDTTLLTNINNNFIWKSFLTFFTPSKIFIFLKTYDYIFNWIIIFYVFYKMTIWWIIDYLVWKIFLLFKKFAKSATTWYKANSHAWWHDDHHDSHWHDEHHDDHHDSHWHDDSHGHWHDSHWHH